MVVPPTLTRGSFMADSEEAKPEPVRAAVFFVLVAAAGIVAALAAASASGPFAGLRASPASTGATSHLIRTVVPLTPIEAGSLFPTPAPPATVQRVVNVYDLPAPASVPSRATTEPADSKSSERDTARHTPPPSPAASPSGNGKPGPDD